MILYLDDDTAAHQLVTSLRKQRHQVTHPTEVGMSGRSDPEHFLYAIKNQLVVLTKNTKDFERLHQLIIGSGGQHPGLLLAKEEDDRAKNMSWRAIVAAMRKLETSGIDLANEATVLNHWR